MLCSEKLMGYVGTDRHLGRVTSSATGNQAVERQELMQGIHYGLALGGGWRRGWKRKQRNDEEGSTALTSLSTRTPVCGKGRCSSVH